MKDTYIAVYPGDQFEDTLSLDRTDGLIKNKLLTVENTSELVCVREVLPGNKVTLSRGLMATKVRTIAGGYKLHAMATDCLPPPEFAEGKEQDTFILRAAYFGLGCAMGFAAEVIWSLLT